MTFMENLLEKFYLSEFTFHDGTNENTLNIADICTVKNEIAVAATREGKTTLMTFDLKSDNGKLYFEFGRKFSAIKVDDFSQVDDYEY